MLPIIGEDSERQRGAVGLLKMMEGREVDAFPSVLTQDEVCWVVTRITGARDGIEAGRKLLAFPPLHFVEANALVMEGADELAERYGYMASDPPTPFTALRR